MKKMCDLVYHDIAYWNCLLWQMQRNRTLTLAGLKARADTFSAAMVACSKALGRNGRMAFVAVLLAASIDQLVKRYIYIYASCNHILCLQSMQIWISKRDGISCILPWNDAGHLNKIYSLWCVWFFAHLIASHLLLQSHQDQQLCPHWRRTPHMSSLGGMVLCFLVMPGHFLCTNMFNGSSTINIIRWKKSIVMVPQAMGWSSRNSIGTSPTSYRRWNPSLHGEKKTYHQHTFSYSENWIKR